jgi:hypothetical protein
MEVFDTSQRNKFPHLRTTTLVSLEDQDYATAGVTTVGLLLPVVGGAFLGRIVRKEVQIARIAEKLTEEAIEAEARVLRVEVEVVSSAPERGVIVAPSKPLNIIDPDFTPVGEYGKLKKTLEGSGYQANHLNQNAAFSKDTTGTSIIPEDEGLSHALRGDAFNEPGTPHYKFHESLEGFWNQYRRGGALEGNRPTNAQYGKALEQALQSAEISPAEAAELAAKAAQQRAAYNLRETDLVPRIPGRGRLPRP